MKVTPGARSCQNATVPGVSLLHEMQTLSGGGLTWSAAGSGPAAGTGRTGGRRRSREKYTPSACPAPTGARKCMTRPHDGRASVCTAAMVGAQVYARPPAELKQVYAPSRQIRVECMFLSPKRNQVHLGGIHLSPAPRQGANGGGKAPPPKRLPAPQAKPRAKCRQELHVRPKELAPKKRRPHQMVRAPTHGTSCGRCNEPQPDAPTSRRAPQPRGRGARPGPGRRPSRGPAPRGSATGRREEPRAPRRHAVRSGTPRGR